MNVPLVHAKMEEHVRIQSTVTFAYVIIPDLMAVTVKIVSHDRMYLSSMAIYKIYILSPVMYLHAISLCQYPETDCSL